MTLTHLLAQYGYWVVFIGSMLEGESVLILAGLAAHQGYLSLPWVILLALSGGTLGDQAYFFLGRYYGVQILDRFPQWHGAADKVNVLLQRFHAGVIVAVRFMYGLRIVGPIVIGMSDVAAWRFIGFNLLGAVIWACSIAGVGYFFGHALQWWLADLKRYEEAVFVLVVVCAAVYALLRYWWHRRPPK